MAQCQILYWQDIPAQVRVFDGRRPLSQKMPDRFQEAIDQSAMEQGLEGTDDYLEQWSWTARQERPGSPQEVLEALLTELEVEFDRRDS